MDVFGSFPNEARVWLYGFQKPLSKSEQREVSARLAEFITRWHSHEVAVRGEFEILHDQFVAITGVSEDGLAGCSIDSVFENFKFLRDARGLDALNRDLVHFRDAGGTITVLDREAFKAEVTAGKIGPDTVVFDLTIPTLGDLRAGRFQTRLSDSWHAAFLPA